MSEKKLRNKIREMIIKEISENKEITREGIFDKILSVIGKAQKRANDKRFIKGLEKLSQTPDGKKKVDDFIKTQMHLDKVTSDAEDLIAKYGL
jgi:cell fate (sporulation/competence/biofilm development) regulator YlbF (YheA/YmcA/DUF963 family)